VPPLLFIYSGAGSIAAEHIKNITDRRGDRGIEGKELRNPGKGVERSQVRPTGELHRQESREGS